MDALWVVGFFGLGVFGQAAFLLWKKFDVAEHGIKLGLALVVPYLMVLLGGLRVSNPLDPAGQAMLYLFFFSVIFVSLFEEEILTAVSEKTVLALNLVAAYLLATHFADALAGNYFLLALVLIPSLATLLNSFLTIHWGFAGKLLFYTWFLALNAFLGFFQFVMDRNWLAPEAYLELGNNPLAVVMYGAMAFGLLANLLYLWLLIPIPGKHQSIESRIRQWKEHTGILTGKYVDEQLKAGGALAIILVLGGAFAANYYFRFVEEATLVSLVFVLANNFSPGDNRRPPI